MVGAPLEEAYLLGSLFGRGSITPGKGSNYKFLLRIPFKEFSPVGLAAVRYLIANGPTDLPKLMSLPEIASGGLATGRVNQILHQTMRWHHPNVPAVRPMLRESGGTWEIRDTTIAREYIGWQVLLNDRETRSIRFILSHLTDTSRFLASAPTLRREQNAFGIIDHVLECEAPGAVFTHFQKTYGLGEGEIHLHWGIPKAVYRFPIDAQQEFLRGLVDAIGDFDTTPISPNWRVQLSVLNQNYRLAVDICQLVQRWLKVPIHYISYAGGKRGSRDHLLKFFVTSFGSFPGPLFYNERKQIEFLEHLAEAKKKLPRPSKIPPSLKFCPRGTVGGPREKKYIKICRANGCPLVQRKGQVSITKWFGKSP